MHLHDDLNVKVLYFSSHTTFTNHYSFEKEGVCQPKSGEDSADTQDIPAALPLKGSYPSGQALLCQAHEQHKYLSDDL